MGQAAPPIVRHDDPTRAKASRPWAHVAVVAAIVLPMLFAFVINRNALNNPPAWDSAITVTPAALTIVERGFDVWAVAQMPSALEGGPSIHATSLYTIGLATLIWLFGSASAFYIAHVTSITLVGAFAAATYLFARERASVEMSALAAAAVSVVPLVVQQASDIYLDLPLAVVATLACLAASRRWFWRAAALVFLAVAIKTAGIFLIPILLLARPETKDRKQHLLHSGLAAVLCTIPFLVAFVNTDRFTQGGQPWTDSTLIVSSALALFLTADVLLLLAIYVVAVFLRARSGSIDRPTRIGALALLGFFATYGVTVLLSGTIMILPRYYIAVLPVMVAGILPVASDTSRKHQLLAAAFCSALLVFSVVNVRGNLYQVPDHDFPVIAERSTRAQELLDMQLEGVRRLVALDLPIVVDRQIFFEVMYPAMGYVEEIPEDVITTFQPPGDLPDEFAMLIERRHQNPLVSVEAWALENGYSLTYEEIISGPFSSHLIVAAR